MNEIIVRCHRRGCLNDTNIYYGPYCKEHLKEEITVPCGSKEIDNLKDEVRYLEYEIEEIEDKIEEIKDKISFLEKENANKKPCQDIVLINSPLLKMLPFNTLEYLSC